MTGRNNICTQGRFDNQQFDTFLGQHSTQEPKTFFPFRTAAVVRATRKHPIRKVWVQTRIQGRL